MKSVGSIRKIAPSTVALAVLAVFLIAAIVTLSVFVASPKATPSAGTMKAQDVETIQLQYSPETVGEFSRSIRAYLNSLFSEFNFEFTNNSVGISKLLYSSFREAGIPADKLLAFGHYLESKDVSKLIGEIIIAYCVPVEGAENELELRFNPDADVSAIIAEKINPFGAFIDVISQNIITAEEGGRLLFYLTVAVSSEEYSTLLKELGVKDFGTIFVNGFELYETISSLTDGQAVSRGEARAVRELAYEMGAEYLDILGSIGGEKLERLIGIGLHNDLFDAEFYGEYVELIFREAKGVPTFFLTVAGKAFTSVSDAPFNAVADYSDTKEGYLLTYAKLSALQIVDASLKDTFDTSLDKVSLIDKLAKISAALSVIGAYVEETSESDTSFEVAYSARYEELNALSDEIEAICDDYKNYEDAESIYALEYGDYVALENRINAVDIDLDSLETGLSKIGSLVMYNTLITLLGGGTAIGG